MTRFFQLTAVLTFVSIFAIPKPSASQWLASTGPILGSVGSVAVDPNDTSRIVVGKSSIAGGTGSVYLSTDGGKSWKYISRNLATFYTPRVAISGPLIFAGTQDLGLWVSTDEGTTWNQPFSSSVDFIDTRARKVWITTSSGFCYTDSVGASWDGSNWQSTSVPFANRAINCCSIIDSGVYVGTDSGVYLIQKNGSTWISTDTVLIDKKIKCIATVNSFVFAGTSGKGVFESSDGGKTWEQVFDNLIDTSISSIGIAGGCVFAGTESGVFVSKDMGASWNKTRPASGDFNVLCLASAGSSEFAGTGSNGLFTSRDRGVKWVLLNGGFGSPPVYSIAGIGSRMFAGTIGGGIYVSEDTGATWYQLALGGSYVYSLLTNGSKVYAGTEGTGVYLSGDSGATWRQANMNLSSPEVSCMVAKGSEVFVGTYHDGIIRSTNGGTTWQQVIIGLPDASVYYIYSLGVYGSNVMTTTGGTIYVSTNDGGNWQANPHSPWPASGVVSSGSNILSGVDEYGVSLSTDGGTIWNLVVSIPDIMYPACFGTVGSAVFTASAFGDVYLSINRGVSWNKVGSGFTTWNIHCITAFGDYVFVATDRDGIWRRSLSELVENPPAAPMLVSPTTSSLDVPDSIRLVWYHVPDAYLYNVQIAGDSSFSHIVLRISTSDTTVTTNLTGDSTYYWRVNAVDSAGEGDWSSVWLFTTSPKTGVMDQSGIPADYVLYQNFPNPFNPSTTVRFGLKERSSVLLTIFNVLGQKVEEHDLGKLDVGFYEQVVNMSHFASGVYICRIHAEGMDKNFVSFRKMILAK
ncbi:MAG TPA: YCF48-related protein [Candidatus Kryptonia bacterium]